MHVSLESVELMQFQVPLRLLSKLLTHKNIHIRISIFHTTQQIEEIYF